MRATLSTDPAEAMAAAGPFLRARPVEHNLILSLLASRVAEPEPGRYVWADDDGTVCGVYLQSPVTFMATVTPMPRAAVEAIVAVLDGIDAPGVNGEAATTAMFAGSWAERRKVAATPVEGLRLYSLGSFVPPAVVSGRLRPAVDADFPTLLRFTQGFFDDTGELLQGRETIEQATRRIVGTRRMWVWERDGETVCMVGAVPGVEGIARIGPVYTPPSHRGRGYAAACTGAVTQLLLDEGFHPALYTQLANPISNSVYRRLGFEPVSENVRYTFG